MNRLHFSVALLLLSVSCFSQANFNITDPEKNFKEAKEFFIKRYSRIENANHLVTASTADCKARN